MVAVITRRLSRTAAGTRRRCHGTITPDALLGSISESAFFDTLAQGSRDPRAIGLTVGAGMQLAATAFHTSTHNVIVSVRLPF